MADHDDAFARIDELCVAIAQSYLRVLPSLLNAA
jgi:hypothetical protein